MTDHFGSFVDLRNATEKRSEIIDAAVLKSLLNPFVKNQSMHFPQQRLPVVNMTSL